MITFDAVISYQGRNKKYLVTRYYIPKTKTKKDQLKEAKREANVSCKLLAEAIDLYEGD